MQLKPSCQVLEFRFSGPLHIIFRGSSAMINTARTKRDSLSHCPRTSFCIAQWHFGKLDDIWFQHAMAVFRPVRRTSRIPRLVLLTALAILVFLALHILRAPTPRFVPSTYDWRSAKQFHAPDTIKPLPKGSLRQLPKVQAPRDSFKNPDKPDPRRDVVKNVFKRSWKAYKDHAWMKDEIRPVTGGNRETFGGFAATAVDTLDTLWIMDLKKEFWEASTAISAMDFAKTSAGAVNLFETTIRHLGGLLSAYDLSGDKALLKKAVELGDMLYMGFDTPNHLPGFWLNFEDAMNGNQLAGTNDPSASPASLCLEFTRLSQITGNAKYYAATDRVTRFLERVQHQTSLPGMWPVTLDFRNEDARVRSYTLGALADSLYEYLPKMHALVGGLDETYEKMYKGAMGTIVQNLLYRPMLPHNENVLFVGDAHTFEDGTRISLNTESQHLTCFAGGMFGLGGKLFDLNEHMFIGERLTRGCGWAYSQFPTGLMPEIFGFHECPTLDGCVWDEELWQSRGNNPKYPKGFKHAREPKYILRPEAIESIFLMYRMTGKEDLRDMAWEMFQSIVKATETGIAYSGIEDVTTKGQTKKLNSMEVSDTVWRSLVSRPVGVASMTGYRGIHVLTDCRAFGPLRP